MRFRRVLLNPFAGQFGAPQGGPQASAPVPQGVQPQAPAQPYAAPALPGPLPGYPQAPAQGQPFVFPAQPFAQSQVPAQPFTFNPGQPFQAPAAPLPAPGYPQAPAQGVPFTAPAPVLAPGFPAIGQPQAPAPGLPSAPAPGMPAPIQDPNVLTVQGQPFTLGQSPVPPTVPGQPTPGQPGYVSLSFDEVQNLVASRVQLQQIQQAQAAQLQQSQAERLAAMARAGNAEQAVRELQGTMTTQLQQANALAEQSALDAAVTRAMAGIPFRDQNAFAMAEEIFRNRVETSRDPSGRISVREKGTGRTVQEAAQSWFTTQGAIFLAPPTTPAAIPPGGYAPNPNPTPAPMNEAERAFLNWQQQYQAMAQQGYIAPAPGPGQSPQG